MAFDDAPQKQSIDPGTKVAYSIIIGAFLTLVTATIPNNSDDETGTLTFDKVPTVIEQKVLGFLFDFAVGLKLYFLN